ncbi:MAG: hypothetical protein IJA41_09300 [Clostridia bacterium]|nr:hypothetical protein [Clostridia bacterium]
MNNIQNKNLPIRRTHRLKEFDYGQYGYYFITVCTNHRKPLLSKIIGSDANVPNSSSNLIVGSDAPVAPSPSSFISGTVIPSQLGEKVLECWHNIERLNENVELDKFVMMPNHIHGIIIIKNTEPIDPVNKIYGFEIAERRGRRSLQGLVKDFKSVTTRIYKNMYGSSESLWQESFYDEIIKSERQYQDVWKYIDVNPLMWHLDELYTKE